MNTRSFLKLVPAILAGIWLSGTLSAQQFHKIGLDEYREAKHIYRNLAPEPQRWFG